MRPRVDAPPDVPAGATFGAPAPGGQQFRRFEAEASPKLGSPAADIRPAPKSPAAVPAPPPKGDSYLPRQYRSGEKPPEAPSEAVVWTEVDTEDWRGLSPGDRMQDPTEIGCCEGISRFVCDLILPLVIMLIALTLYGVLAIAIRESRNHGSSATNSTGLRKPSNVTIRGRNIYVEGKLFIVRGVAYSPVWSGQDASSDYPFGDYTFKPKISVGQFYESFRGSEFKRFNDFHLEKISKSFNTIRLYNWQLDKDHTEFLDSCWKYGLMVIASFWLDSHTYDPIGKADVQHKAETNFEHMVRRYKRHPAILMWAIGNEPNDPGNAYGFSEEMPAFFKLCEKLRQIRDQEERPEFGFQPHPIVVPMADADNVQDFLSTFDRSTGFDVWGMQPYKSPMDVNNFLLNMAIQKPMVITEFGMDSLWDTSPTGNEAPSSAFERHSTAPNATDEQFQAETVANLTRILFKFMAGKTQMQICDPGTPCDPHSGVPVQSLPWPETVTDGDPVNEGYYNPETRYQEQKWRDQGNRLVHMGQVLSAFRNPKASINRDRYDRLAGVVVFEWMDEWWKGHKLDPDHPDCDDDQPSLQSSCGTMNRGFGHDWRMNEEWLGVSAQVPKNTTSERSCIRPKPVFYKLQELFGRVTTLDSVNRSQMFCWDGGPGTVDVGYLTRPLRVAANSSDGRAAVPFGSLQVPALRAAVTAWNRGGQQIAQPEGHFNLTDLSDKHILLNWSLSGVDTACSGPPPSGVANACGLHVHAGMTCEHAASVGGHYWYEPRWPTDPWVNVTYQAANGSSSTGSAQIDIGYLMPHIVGHALVVHNADGDRVACAVVDTTPGSPPTDAVASDFTVYPGYSGSLSVSGSVALTDVSPRPVLFRGVFSTAPAGQLRVQVLSGRECYSAYTMGAPLYHPRMADPWQSAAAQQAPRFAFQLDVGYPLGAMLGRVAAVWDAAGQLIACELIRPQTLSEAVADFSAFSAKSDGAVLVGQLQLLDVSLKPIRYDWDMQNLDNRACGTRAAGTYECAFSVQNQSMPSTWLGYRAEQLKLPFMQNEIVREDPFGDSTSYYLSNGSGFSSGSVVLDHGKALRDMDLQWLVFIDNASGTERAVAVGQISVPVDVVGAKYDGYDMEVEDSCCVDSPMRDLIEYPLWLHLVVLASILAIAALAMSALRCRMHITSGDELRRKHSVNDALAASTLAASGAGLPLSAPESPTSQEAGSPRQRGAAGGNAGAGLFGSSDAFRQRDCFGPPAWLDGDRGAYAAYLEPMAKEDVEVSRQGSTPVREVRDYCCFRQVRQYLLQNAGIEEVLSDMECAFANPHQWDAWHQVWVPRKSARSTALAKEAKPWGHVELWREAQPPIKKGQCVLVVPEGASPQGTAAERWGVVKAQVDDQFFAVECTEKVKVPSKDGKEKREEQAKVTNYRASRLRNVAAVYFGDSQTPHGVMLTKDLAEELCGQAYQTTRSKPEVKWGSLPRYNLRLVYEALVFAIGSAVLRSGFDYFEDYDSQEQCCAHQSRPSGPRENLLGHRHADLFGPAGLPDRPTQDGQREVARRLLSACTQVFNEVVPKECREVRLAPGPAAGATRASWQHGSKWDGTFWHPALGALLFLAIQQRVDGLRQCRWMKAVVFNHIATAWSRADGQPDGPGAQRQRTFSAMRELTNVCQHHLELVQEDSINYADVDEIYKTVFRATYPHRGGGLLPWPLVVDRRSVGRHKNFQEIIEIAKKGQRMCKTFPERLSWFVPLRLFGFTVHGHLVLFYAVLSFQMDFSWSTMWWLLGAVESLFCILNRLIDMWMFPCPRYFIRFSLLSIVELAAAVAFGVLKWRPPSEEDGDEIDVFTTIFLAFMYSSQCVVRPFATLLWKLEHGFASVFKVLPWRALTLTAMFFMQVIVAWFFISPSVATLSLNLCRCPEAAINTLVDWNGLLGGHSSTEQCETDVRDVLCFVGVGTFFLCTYVSLTLMAHVSYMFLSIVCGYIVGIRKKLGTSKDWAQVRVTFEHLIVKDRPAVSLEANKKCASIIPDLGIYGNFTPHTCTGDQVLLRVECGKDMKQMNTIRRSSDPFVRVTAGSEQQKTLAQKGTLCPRWHRDLIFSSGTPAAARRQFTFEVYDHEELREPQKMGEAVLTVGEPQWDGRWRHWRLQLVHEGAEAGFLDVSVAYPLRGVAKIDCPPSSVAMHHQLRMYRNMFEHLWERDLISHTQYRQYAQWNFAKEPPEEALIHVLQFLNGHAGLKSLFPADRLVLSQKEWVIPVLQQRVSVFQMRSVTFFCPYYSETVLMTMDDLKKDDLLVHMADVFDAEWSNFCGRNFFGCQDSEKVLNAFRAGTAHELWVQERDQYEDRCFTRKAKWGTYRWRYDPPPLSLIENPELEAVRKEELNRLSKRGASESPGLTGPVGQQWRRWVREHEMDKFTDYKATIQYWIERQVRIWASMRGQTLIRTVYGLHEMREAVVDLAYFELKSADGALWLEEPFFPTKRSAVLDVCGWVHQNAAGPAPDKWMPGVGGKFTKVGSVDFSDAVVFLCRLHRIDGTWLFQTLKDQWVGMLSEQSYLEQVEPWLEKDAKGVLGGLKDPHTLEALARQITEAVWFAAQSAVLRERAETLVSTRLQLCFGAQVYWGNDTVRQATNELLRMDRLRHLELATDPSKGKWESAHVRRRSAPVSRVNFLQLFGAPVKGGKVLADFRDEERHLFEVTYFPRQSPLKLGEGKAENQNNMITCARGEILQILDMNQDGYYAEGVKLPLVLNLWNKVSSAELRQEDDALRMGSSHNDYFQVLGFREHIFTQCHSAVGRYMALAEFSFVTLIQRFLANPHEVRMHYGHPDMVNAFLMKQTGGVSRAATGVNVNEDIFLGYEMASTGKNIAMIEYLSYGKGREVDFNNASVFLKKLSAGCVMQLSSREVHNLYTKGLAPAQKWALFYGSLAHFLNIYMMDFSVFLFTYTLMIFALADLTPQNFRLNESPLSEPWMVQIGMFYILPMVVEMNLEKSYLRVSDFIMSIPFFAHQNRITASYFGATMHTGGGKYMGTDRGMGNAPRTFVDFYLAHTTTNFVPALKLLLCASVYWWAGYGCHECTSSDSDLFRMWIVLVSAFSYLMAPALYNPKPSFSTCWREWSRTMEWVADEEEIGPLLPESMINAGDWEKWSKEAMKRSMRVFWAFEWYEHLNAKGVNATGQGCGRVADAFGCFCKEFCIILAKYVLWIMVPAFALTMKRGEEVVVTDADGTLTTKQPNLLTFRWDLFFFVCLDVAAFLMSVLRSSIMRRLSLSARTEIIPRVIKLTVLPLLYLVILVTIFLVHEDPVLESLFMFFSYLIFSGISVAAVTEVFLAFVQLRLNLLEIKGQRSQRNPSLSTQHLTKWSELRWGNELGYLHPAAGSGDDLKAAKACAAVHHATGKVLPIHGETKEFRIAGQQPTEDKSDMLYTVSFDVAVIRKQRRLWYLLWFSTWNPLVLFYQRLFYVVGLFLLVPTVLLSGIAKLHTTWLFTEKVARRQAGGK